MRRLARLSGSRRGWADLCRVRHFPAVPRMWSALARGSGQLTRKGKRATTPALARVVARKTILDAGYSILAVLTLLAVLTFHPPPSDGKIGRASCRERV